MSSEEAPKKVEVRSADINDEVREFVEDLVVEATAKHTVEVDIASYIKKEMDSLYGQPWHCIVGASFGSYVTHSRGNFIYLTVNGLTVLLFKT